MKGKRRRVERPPQYNRERQLPTRSVRNRMHTDDDLVSRKKQAQGNGNREGTTGSSLCDMVSQRYNGRLPGRGYSASLPDGTSEAITDVRGSNEEKEPRPRYCE